MHKTLTTAAATALLAASSVSLAEINACDAEVTRARDADERVCYAQFGPQSGRWDPRHTPELDACLKDALGRFKVKRWLCHDITFRNVDYDKLG